MVRQQMDVNELPVLMRDERTASREEGREVDDSTAQAVEEWLTQAAARQATGETLSTSFVSAGEQLYEAMQTAPIRKDFPYEEPQTWEAICGAWSQPEERLTPPHGAELRDRVLAGWLGRAAGCLLGKPVEGWSRERIERLLQVNGLAELTDYLPETDQGDSDLTLRCPPGWCRGSIHGMVRDDDLDYTVIALRVLETYGFDFTPQQVGDFWLTHLPYYKVYTAERAAYRNRVDGILPPQSAWRYNPYREWIGAQIRADLYGYVCPGDPRRAARLAFQDATLSHTGNGVYGAMWVAATVAAAFVTRSPAEAVTTGLQYIPARSRLAEAVRDCLAWKRSEPSWASAWARLNERYGQYHPVHTINNAGLVVLALLYGEGDFARTVGLAVRGGWDTDCNGATAGSILGACLGTQKLPASLVAPLEDRLQTALADEGELRFTDLAARTVQLVHA